MSKPALADYTLVQARRCEEQPPGDPPLVSIITVSWNAAPTIARTIESVQGQGFPSIEQIFIDGGSTDGTLEHVRRLMRPRDYLLSEPDRGISDAFNKGVSLARGRYIQFLNADDWLSPDQIERAVALLQRSGADYVFGDLVFYEDGRPRHAFVGDPAYARAIHRRMPAIGHPTVLATHDLFEQVGLFDLSLKNAMDYDWLYRVHRAGGRGAYGAEIIGHMTWEGVSNRQFARTIDEVRRIAVSHGRNSMVAGAEAQFRYWKTRSSHLLKSYARPVYDLVRQTINPSFRPL
jgi:glycosyltransferase involved in cell wall biosynthesis